jgi:hypothetical protein
MDGSWMTRLCVFIAAFLTGFPIVTLPTRSIIAINAGGGTEVETSTGIVFEQDRCDRPSDSLAALAVLHVNDSHLTIGDGSVSAITPAGWSVAVERTSLSMGRTFPAYIR